jgi:pimeloyl-ACP methyl ester carboxylesterase
LYNRAAAKQAEQHTPPIGRFVEVGESRLHYLRTGEGSPVILIHGNGTLIQDWEISGIVGALAQKHEVIAFDRPGFGYSSRPRNTIWTAAAQAQLLSDALGQLGVKAATIVGHSFGSLVSAQLALDSPERVKRLVLLSGYYYPTARVDAVINMPLAMPLIGDALSYTISPLLGRAMTKAAYKAIFYPAPVPQTWTRNFPREMAMRPSQLRAVSADGAVMIPSAAKLSKRYAELELPITIIVGDGDTIADPNEQSVRLHNDVPHSHLLVLNDVGHMVHHTKGDQVIDAILSGEHLL